jgi:hypothetical protein
MIGFFFSLFVTGRAGGATPPPLGGAIYTDAVAWPDGDILLWPDGDVVGWGS